MPLTLPDGILGMADRGPDWADWVDRLPRMVSELSEEWGLEPAGIPMHGFVGLVVPVLADGRPAALKISFPDDETAHEHLALRRWGGRAAVELLRADPRRRALLLDGLEQDKLASIDVEEACEQVAATYALLHVPATDQYHRLSSFCERWERRLAEVPRSSPVPHRLVAQARSLAAELGGDEATDGTLIHFDLHYDNVLRAPEGSSYETPWVVIDPKPMSGDPHVEPVPMLWTRWDEALETHDVRGEVRHRLHTIVDAAGLDEDRAVAWAVLRMVTFAFEQIRDPGPDTEAQVTKAVTIAKAVQGDD